MNKISETARIRKKPTILGKLKENATTIGAIGALILGTSALVTRATKECDSNSKEATTTTIDYEATTTTTDYEATIERLDLLIARLENAKRIATILERAQRGEIELPENLDESMLEDPQSLEYTLDMAAAWKDIVEGNGDLPQEKDGAIVDDPNYR